MPWLYWEDEGTDYVYALDWTFGAFVTLVAVATLVASVRWSVRWARRSAETRPSKGAGVAVVLASVVTLAAAGLLVFGVARSRLFEGMFGRSSDVVEHFWWPMMIQVWVSGVAGLVVASVGVRAVRRGVDRPAALQHLCLAGVASLALGYGVWLRPGEGMAVLDVDHPVARPLKGTLAWIHDSAAYVPTVETALPGWRLVSVQPRRRDGMLEIEAHAVRGPLTSRKRFFVPLVADDGDARLPLTVGRPWHFDEVAVEQDEGEALRVVPWSLQTPPREMVIELVAERWLEGRRVLEVRRTVDGTRQQLDVYAFEGVWWTTVYRWLRQQSLVELWLGRCVPGPARADGDPGTGRLLCRSAHGYGWRLRPTSHEGRVTGHR